MNFLQKCSLVFCLGLLLGIYKGRIALWNQDDPQPIIVFQYRACSLPPADQMMLQEGIIINNDAQLAQLLEDLMS